jgi:2-phosphosulfolactate phosphatase
VTKTVVVDCFAESAPAYRDGYAAVAIDVIRATTTAITAVETGRECYPVPSIEAALPLAAKLNDPLLAGELGGNMPYGFEVTNSPAELASRTDVERPLILLSTSGTKLIHEAAAAADAVFVAALRNYGATARDLAERFDKVAVLGAGTRGEFRQEDQMCCALLADKLIEAGFEPQDDRTDTIVRRWRGQPIDAITESKSVAYLRNTGQLEDLEFVLGHVDDVDRAFEFRDGRVVPAS